MNAKIKDWLSDIYFVFKRECDRVLHDSGVMLIFIAAGFGYPLLYNVMYHNGVLEDTPIAVVDNSNSEYSRRYIREVDATRELRVAEKCTSMDEARKLMERRKVNGIIYFPEDFGHKVATHQTATLSIYADMSSFLYYKNLMLGANFVMLDEIKNIEIRRYEEAGLDGATISQLTTAIPYEENNPYNRTFSYTIFFLSAVLFLVIQQVMFFGMAMAAGTMREEDKSFVKERANVHGWGVGRIVIGRGLLYWLLFVLIGIYVAFVVPGLFHFPQRGDFWQILALLLIFVTDCVFFSMTWSTLITRREAALILLLFISPVVIFLTGFSWPECAFPPFWKIVSYIFPTTFGSRAFINMNTAGCDILMVQNLMQAMLVQTAVYMLLACASIYFEEHLSARSSRIAKARQGKIAG